MSVRILSKGMTFFGAVIILTMIHFKAFSMTCRSLLLEDNSTKLSQSVIDQSKDIIRQRLEAVLELVDTKFVNAAKVNIATDMVLLRLRLGYDITEIWLKDHIDPLLGATALKLIPPATRDSAAELLIERTKAISQLLGIETYNGKHVFTAQDLILLRLRLGYDITEIWLKDHIDPLLGATAIQKNKDVSAINDQAKKVIRNRTDAILKRLGIEEINAELYHRAIDLVLLRMLSGYSIDEPWLRDNIDPLLGVVPKTLRGLI
ncbi:MAG: hypothetical protein JNM39_06455 [Bdellovibrionaceae bacterium]|nr:hypothetical protein [Pseudobdellovibrionaceae bacterium]